MLTLKQVRDVFFSLLNISHAQQRVEQSEQNIDKLTTRCYKLAFDDEQLSNRLQKDMKEVDS